MIRPSGKNVTYNSHKERKITDLMESTIPESTYGLPLQGILSNSTLTELQRVIQVKQDLAAFSEIMKVSHS